MRSWRVALGALATVALVAAACGAGGDGSSAASRRTTTTVAVRSAGGCDPVDPAACLLPWPNDRFTRTDSTTDTGLRLDLPADSTPANVSGVHIDPSEWNRSDGFSPSSVGLTVVPHLDLAASKLPPQTDIGASMQADANLAVLDVETGHRIPAWAELDLDVTDPEQTLLRVVPAVALAEGHRIAIGLRNLRTTTGAAVQRRAAFADLVESPSKADERWLGALDDAGMLRAELTVAWSFTVASADGLSARLRHMWDESETELGAGAPPFRVEQVDKVGTSRVVRGSFEMPNYLKGDGGPGAVFNNDGDPDGLPRRNATMRDEFLCIVPDHADAPFVIYGHGLLNSRNEVMDIGMLGASVGIGFCALDFLGMSTPDVPTVLAAFDDLSKFRTLPDRLQQGHLGFLLLGRLLASEAGFVTDAAFQVAGKPAIDHSRLAFLGASQGGILGGVSSALTPDWHRVVLAVGGQGYNLLLRRSVDFDKFQPPFTAAYPKPLDRAIAIEMIQVLWDRGENSGYSQHLTTAPYRGGDAPSATVLLLEAFGDHQVANVATEKLTRTLRVGRRVPTLADGRSPDAHPFYGIDPIEKLPWKGSGLVVWDFGTPPPPVGQTPPREGSDPHGKLADVPQALALLVSFIPPDGAITDVCGSGPCRSDG